jgi:hypothetical protein
LKQVPLQLRRLDESGDGMSNYLVERAIDEPALSRLDRSEDWPTRSRRARLNLEELLGGALHSLCYGAWGVPEAIREQA